ncbi:MAG TPA: DUF4397 domain-containing protein, partial [Candidatus Kapabacteria bacterium]|nr:DUF4397 domain-containing protein [Candidatus Kapabacteria bacterium]
MGRILPFYIVSIAIILTAFTGCQQTCSNIPNQSPASIRIVDAVANADTLNVFIDGKLFGVAYYDPQAYSSIGNNSFGYHQTYLAGGLAVTAGTHHVAAVVAGTHDTIVSTNVALIDHRQTLVFFGRYHGTAAQHPQLKYLDDETRIPDNSENYIRFLEAVPDMSGVDVYFSNIVKISGGKPSPDITLSYGEISDNLGGGSGTGRSANDYFRIPSNDSTGLLITVKGDTSTKLFTFSEP